MTRLPLRFAGLLLCLLTTVPPRPLAAQSSPATTAITPADAAAAEKLAGLQFTPAQNEQLAANLSERLRDYAVLHQFPFSNAIPSALLFNPLPAGFVLPTARSPFRLAPAPRTTRPAAPDELAFYSVRELGVLLHNRRITSEELTRLYLARLREYGPRLHCVTTLTEERALREARRADREIAAGHYRGPLHGIPYGVKDLLNTAGAPTTWGAAPYTNQTFAADATVIQRLEAAGAVLVAKLSLGELAMGDVWYGGLTRTPWNLEQGSSGSSAGPAAATAAGLVGFAIGSETHGSIVSPCERCGVTGLRPTYGRVSRAGAMGLSPTMDKLGPIARTVEDCALVLNAIQGIDPADPTVYDVPFNYDGRPAAWRRLRIGWLAGDFEKCRGADRTNAFAALDQLRALGARLTPVRLPELPAESISFVLTVEAAAQFDDLTRDGRDAWLSRQGRWAWPNLFRAARLVPAVEYLQANRLRYLLIQETAAALRDVDVFIAPTFAGECHLISNLTGHPCVVVPDGFAADGSPTAICFMGNLFRDGEALAVAQAYQQAAGFHRRHPRLPAP